MLHAILMILLIVLVAIVINRLSPGLLYRWSKNLANFGLVLLKFILIVSLIIGMFVFFYDRAEKRKQQELPATNQSLSGTKVPDSDLPKPKSNLDLSRLTDSELIAMSNNDYSRLSNASVEDLNNQMLFGKENQEKIKLALIEIAKTEQYNDTFRKHLKQVRDSNGPISEYNRIIDAMDQNERYIASQQDVIKSVVKIQQK